MFVCTHTYIYIYTCMYAIYRIILISADRKCVFSSLSLSLSLSFFSARGSRHPICPVHTDGPQCPLTGAYAGCILILRAESAVKVRVRTNSAWNEVLSLPIHYPKYNSWVPRTKSIKYKTTLSIFWTQGQNQTKEQIQPKDRSAGLAERIKPRTSCPTAPCVGFGPQITRR